MKELVDRRLQPHNTFGVPAGAGRIVALESAQDLEAIDFDPARDLLLGGGSNVLLVDDVPGTLYLNRMRGIDLLNGAETDGGVRVAGGEHWHDLVRWTLGQGLSGLENLSLIPGLAGAAPMQNIGAYGVELSSVLTGLTAWDWQLRQWREFTAEACRFAYRDSRFKSREPGRYLITSIELRLERAFSPRLHYPGLAEELRDMGIERPGALDVSDAVVRIRQRRLPDPGVVGNAGSFFKNPVLPADQAAAVQSLFPDIPLFPQPGDLAKLSAAWMIEFCGWKGNRQGQAGVSDRHALVLVNHGGASGRDLLELARRIEASVFDTFGVRLENEPRIIEFAQE